MPRSSKSKVGIISITDGFKNLSVPLQFRFCDQIKTNMAAKNRKLKAKAAVAKQSSSSSQHDPCQQKQNSNNFFKWFVLSFFLLAITLTSYQDIFGFIYGLSGKLNSNKQPHGHDYVDVADDHGKLPYEQKTNGINHKSRQNKQNKGFIFFLIF